jgi:A/G-specific adenine glycosylase
MTEVPTTAFLVDFDQAGALALAPRFAASRADAGNWRRLAGVVTHVFTHFPLELVVYRMQVPQAAPAPAGMRWLSAGDIAGAALPSLMRKVLVHARVA